MKIIIESTRYIDRFCVKDSHGKAQEAIALIHDSYLKESAYLVCPSCGGKMRSDNKTGICQKCQKKKQPNSKYRRN
jgi:hypothetical protein